MDSRSYLIGAGSVLTSAYVDKANQFLRNKSLVIPLPNPNKDTTKVFFVNQGIEYELRFENPDFGSERLT